MRKIIIPAIILLGLAGYYTTQKPTLEDNTIMVAEDDAAMNASQDLARQTLDKYFAYIDTNPAGVSSANIKVAIQGDSYVEQIWVTSAQTQDGQNFTGYLGNDPDQLGDLKAGEKVEFIKDQISDWSFVKDDKGYGFYSVRVLLPKIPKEEAEGLMQFLAEDPLPDFW